MRFGILLSALLSVSALAQQPITPAPAAPTVPAAPTAPAAATPAAPAVVAPAAAPDKKATAATGDVETGKAVYYGRKFAGRRTASGQRFNPAAMTAAHNTLPFGTKVKVTNTKNNRSVVVVINDRGPSTPGRIIDVSAAAAKKLGFIRAGIAEVKVEVVGKTAGRAARRSPKSAKAA